MRRRLKAQKKYKRIILIQVLVILALGVVWVLCTKCNGTALQATNPVIESASSDSLPEADSLVDNPKPSTIEDENPDTADKDFLLGKTDFSHHPDFTNLESRYGTAGLPIRKDVYNAFKEMYAAALEDGIELRILSAARNWSRQRSIWEGRLNSLGWRASMSRQDKVRIMQQALQYVSMPGISRHHWGTEIDLNNLEPSYFTRGQGKRILDWLKLHAAEHGFYQTYTDKAETGRTGFSNEPWHWSYKPLSQGFFQAYLRHVSYTDFVGFTGAELAEDVQAIELYVEGINPILK
ncbi:MAG TPA: M15 family metallopeptidase [Candidatus Cloacimonadota bacterium]|nr:M15 family metallopeptidase [Candidatus Cloacimonadota bacterium]